MAGQRALIPGYFFLFGTLLSDAAKILTMSSIGGSHYLLMDRVSQILQDHGHNVTMFYQGGNTFVSGFKEEEKSYKFINWAPPEDFQKEFTKYFDFFMEEALARRGSFEQFLKLIEQLSVQCSHLLHRKDILDSLRNENFDLLVVEFFDYCPFLVAEKLKKPFVSLLPCFLSSMDTGLPSPISYVPAFHSSLTDRMDFWDRVKNLFMFFNYSMKKRKIFSQYDNTIQEHFAEGSRPVLSDLLQKAECGLSTLTLPWSLPVPCFPTLFTLEAYWPNLLNQYHKYKSAAMAARTIRLSHPLTPAQRLVGWIEHILQTGGAAHLKPYVFQQPRHEQYVLDVVLFLLGLTLATLWLCGKVLALVTRWLSRVRKAKKA